MDTNKAAVVSADVDSSPGIKDQTLIENPRRWVLKLRYVHWNVQSVIRVAQLAVQASCVA